MGKTFMTEQYCENCEHVTKHEVDKIEERWQDSSIDDCDLTTAEVVARANNDVVTRYTCCICYHSEDVI